MKAGLLFGVAGLVGLGLLAYSARDDEEEGPIIDPEDLPPPGVQTTPTSVTFPAINGQCPPGSVTLANGLCAAQLPTQFPVAKLATMGERTGGCCASCDAGGPCEGCG